MGTVEKLKPLYACVQQEVFRHLPNNLFYHIELHTQNVMANAMLLSEEAQLSSRQEELLYAAAILHDTGYGKKYKSNEGVASLLAGKLLPDFGFLPDEIEIVQNMILATNLIINPGSKLEMLLSDADMGYLGQEDFLIWSDRLLREWRLHHIFNGTDKEWLEGQKQFVKKYRYNTLEAGQLFNAGKATNLAYLNSLEEWPY